MAGSSLRSLLWSLYIGKLNTCAPSSRDIRGRERERERDGNRRRERGRGIKKMTKKEGPGFLFLTLGCRPSHHLGCILFRSHFLMTVRFHKDVHSSRQ